MKTRLVSDEKILAELDQKKEEKTCISNTLNFDDIATFQEYCTQQIESNNFDEAQVCIQQFINFNHDAFSFEHTFLERIYTLSINFEHLNCAIDALKLLHIVFKYDSDSRSEYQNPDAFADLINFFRKEGDNIFHQDEVDYYCAILRVHYTMIDFLDHLDIISTLFLYNHYNSDSVAVEYFAQIANMTIKQSVYSQNKENILHYIHSKTIEILECTQEIESCQKLLHTFLKINKHSSTRKEFNPLSFRIIQSMFDDLEEKYKIAFIDSINYIDLDFFPLGYSWIYERFIDASGRLKASFIEFLSIRITLTDCIEFLKYDKFVESFMNLLGDFNPKYISRILHFVNRILHIIPAYPNDELSDFIFSYNVINFLTEIGASDLSAEDFHILVRTAYLACNHFIHTSNIEALQIILNDDFISSLEDFEFQKESNTEPLVEGLRQLYEAASKFE